MNGCFAMAFAGDLMAILAAVDLISLRAVRHAWHVCAWTLAFVRGNVRAERLSCGFSWANDLLDSGMVCPGGFIFNLRHTVERDANTTEMSYDFWSIEKIL